MSFGGSSSTTVTGFALKKFESQDQVDEKKKRRQEEWEEVRKPDEPLERPEEPEDNRCLYDKLEAQRLGKQEELDEKHKFKNQIAKLDDDEAEFLDFVSDRQQEIKKARNQEEKDLISELKDARVVTIPVQESKQEDKKPTKPTQRVATKRSSQMALLAGAVKPKRSEDSIPNKKSKTDSAEEGSPSGSDPETSRIENTTADTTSTSTPSSVTTPLSSAAVVIGVRPSCLPGIIQYEDTSDSMSSSSDSEPEFSLSARNSISNFVRQQIAAANKQQQQQ